MFHLVVHTQPLLLACVRGLTIMPHEALPGPHICNMPGPHPLLHSCTQKMHAILTGGGLLVALGRDPMLMMAGYLAAIMHDYQHRGVSNQFLVVTEDPIALTYNDMRPHENHHVAAAWLLACQPVGSSVGSRGRAELRWASVFHD